MNPRLRIAAAALLVIVSVVSVFGLRRTPVRKPSTPDPFEAKVARFEALDRTNRPPRSPILFVGSSSIEKWPTLQTAFPGEAVLNRGVSSFKLKDLLRYFDRIVLPYQPGKVVLYGGDNDIDAGLSVEATLALYREFLDRLDRAFPGTPVLLLAVKASPKRIQQLALQVELNRRLVDLAKARPRTDWVDTFSPLNDASGRPDPRWFLDDQLHLNAQGYGLWNEVLRPVLARRPGNPNPKTP